MKETDHTERLLLICPAAQREAANAAVRELAGGEVFAAPLVGEAAEKGASATHYAACWQVTPADRARVGAALAGVAGMVSRPLGHWDPGATIPEVQAELAGRGLKRGGDAEKGEP